MIKYSFTGRNSNCTKDEAINFLRATDKPMLYTSGLRFRNPVIMDIPISRETAIEHLTQSWCDVTEYDDHVRVNTFTSNDMW